MTKPVRIGIIGAGGVGGYYGGLLARAGHPVSFLARRANLDALRAHGIVVHTPDGNWTSAILASDDPRELSTSFREGDLVLVTTKAYSLSEVGAAVKMFAGGGATILPLLNGVEAAASLIELGVPREQIIGGVTYISAVRIAPGVVERHDARQRVIVGVLPRGTSPAVKQVAAIFQNAGAEGVASDDITVALWQKFVFLVSLAGACGLTRLPVGRVRETPLGARLLERAVREAVAVGRARGVALREDEEAQVMSMLAAIPAETVPSLLRDIRSGSRTEVDVLSGAISRFAAESGIDTPVHDTIAIALAQTSSMSH